MATMIFTHQQARTWREALRYFIRNLINHHHPWTNNKSTSTACDAIAELQRAFRTIRMASNPGEDYETVAARIDREAANYRAFLRNPTPIGKVALNIKQLDTDEFHVWSTREQYRVSDPAEGHGDPAEGRASVCYTFNRSNDKVLEFFVLDEKGEPLFPIARTYSNWIGTKEFNLGLDRTFFLNMVEDAPGYVLVQAGFTSRTESDKEVTSREDLEPRSMAVGAGGGRNATENRNSLISPFARPAYVAGLACFAVSFVFGLAIWSSLADSRAIAKTELTHSASQPGLARDSTGGAWGQDSAKPEAETQPGAGDSSISMSHQEGRPAADAHKVKRLADITAVRISIDNSACKETADRCRELLKDVQQEMHEKLSSLGSSVSPHDPGDSHPVAAELVVSYQPVDWQHGNVHLTLSDEQGPLWDDGHGISCGENDQMDFINDYSDEASKEILSEIQWAREHVNSGAVYGRAITLTEGR